MDFMFFSMIEWLKWGLSCCLVIVCVVDDGEGLGDVGDVWVDIAGCVWVGGVDGEKWIVIKWCGVGKSVAIHLVK